MAAWGTCDIGVPLIVCALWLSRCCCWDDWWLWWCCCCWLFSCCWVVKRGCCSGGLVLRIGGRGGILVLMLWTPITLPFGWSLLCWASKSKQNVRLMNIHWKQFVCLLAFQRLSQGILFSNILYGFAYYTTFEWGDDAYSISFIEFVTENHSRYGLLKHRCEVIGMGRLSENMKDNRHITHTHNKIPVYSAELIFPWIRRYNKEFPGIDDH